MMKTLTWISLGLSILGALADLRGGGSDESGVETAAEIALLAKAFAPGGAGMVPDDADTQTSRRR